MDMSQASNGSTGSRDSVSATSRSLIARVRGNEPEAWDRLVKLYAPLIVHWCRGTGLQEHDNADVLQEVFKAVVTNVGNFKKQGGSDTFRGWLRRITQNKVHDHFRKFKKDAHGVGGSTARQQFEQLPDAPPVSESTPPDASAERALFARALELIRAEFEERTLQAFWRTAVEGQAANDVATDLGMSPGAVRVAKSRVLQRLREELGELNE